MVAEKNHGLPTQVQGRKRSYGTLSALSWNSHSCVTQVCVQRTCFADGFMVGAGGEEVVREARMEKQYWSQNEVKFMRIMRPCPNGVIASWGLDTTFTKIRYSRNAEELDRWRKCFDIKTRHLIRAWWRTQCSALSVLCSVVLTSDVRALQLHSSIFMWHMHSQPFTQDVFIALSTTSEFPNLAISATWDHLSL